jgi:hypothetical protein
MTEQELRALVRQAIARHTGTHSPTDVGSFSAFAEASADRRSSLASGGWSDPPSVLSDPAHAMFVVPTGADADGPCIIEPAVMCNHCGYCKSLGH